MIRSTIFDNAPRRERILMFVLGWLLGKNSEQGAQTIIHSCLVPPYRNQISSLNGKYLSDCREEVVFRSRQLGDIKLEDTLYQYTQDLLSIAT